MGLFEKFLSIWVALAITAGIVIGVSFPGFIELIGGFEYAGVNIVIALFMWAMIYPMMAQIDFSKFGFPKEHQKGLGLTLVINWLIKPFTMTAIGYLFFFHFYSGFWDESLSEQYLAGLILLGVAPCTAMVFVWSYLTKGNANYTLIQVTVNDIVLLFAFAPITALLLGLTDIVIPWNTLLMSVVLFVLVPLLAGWATHEMLKAKPKEKQKNFLAKLRPFSIASLLATVALIFSFQADKILSSPGTIALIAIPLTIQTFFIFFISYGAAKLIRLPHDIASPSALIGTSNFFELAVAVAITVFGLGSGAALATVVGVLVEVPLMLVLVKIANASRGWFETRVSAG
ncbi:MAG: ACR3 family arsenite efflux transporter [Oligoflexus sp.]